MRRYKLHWVKDRDQRVVVNVSDWLLVLFLRAHFYSHFFPIYLPIICMQELTDLLITLNLDPGIE